MQKVLSGILKLALTLVIASFLVPSLLAPPLMADEGMWTYDQIPRNQLKERYDFQPSKAWLDHLRLSSVRIYASASFVSPDGLILTNHHVALMSAQRLSTPDRDLVNNGFYAPSYEDEIPIPSLSVEVLQSIKDVTKEIEAATAKAANPAEAVTLRRAAIAKIETQCEEESGLRGEVESEYGGAKYVLYRYKTYNDLRLVFIPEIQSAAFGGDYDNFAYPRYALDMAFLRAYEDGKPAKVKNYLKVNPEGAKDGDFIAVSGHPASTDRLQTLASLKYLRDVVFPQRISRLNHGEKLLRNWAKGDAERARLVRTTLFFYANSLKAITGELKGLNDPDLMAMKTKSENSIRKGVAGDKNLEASIGNPWQELESAYKWVAKHDNDRLYKSRIPGAGWGRLPSLAQRMVRYAQEVRKPDSERLSGYNEANLPYLLRSLNTTSPFYKEVDELILTDDLKSMAKALGNDDPYLQKLLQGRTPEETAKNIIEGTRLYDSAYRENLLKKKGKAILKSKDPLLKFVMAADPTLRATEKLFEKNYDSVITDAYPKIARAEFAVMGRETYPDANGTLRFSYGKIAGYPFATTLAPPFTTFYGLYDRAFSFGNKLPFQLTKKAMDARNNIKLDTPMDFVCTADITGGNSGSPVVDRQGELVGLVFDGNQFSHPNTFVYREDQARCVAVDIRGILESLDKIYHAKPLVKELTGKE